MDYSAPALGRGIEIMRFLQEKGQVSLEGIASVLDMPKSSAARFMDTLEVTGVVGRNETDKRYFLKQMLVEISSSKNLSQARIIEELNIIAQKTSSTAEWYVHNDSGMVLVNRKEPENVYVSVRATIGYVRSCRDELEAVAALGLAFFNSCKLKGKKYDEFVADGERADLSVDKAKGKVELALSQKYIADLYFNNQGVRRIAAVVFHGGEPVGVLAIAENFLPNIERDPKVKLRIILDSVKRLSKI